MGSGQHRTMARAASATFLVVLLLASFIGPLASYDEGPAPILEEVQDAMSASGRSSTKGFLTSGGTGSAQDLAFFTSVDAHSQGSLAAMRYTADVTFGSQTVSATCPYAQQLQDLCDAAIIGLTESGSYAWGSAIDTSNGAVTGISVAAGAGGEAFVGGDYLGSLVFGGSPAFAFSQINEGFVAKTDPTGNWMWGVGYTTIDGGFGAVSIVTDVAMDMSGNHYATGYFVGETDFGGQSINVSDLQTFVAKYTQGGVLDWVIDVGGLSNDIGIALATTQTGSVHLAMVTNSATINAASTLYSLVGSQDVVLMEIDPSGAVLSLDGYGVPNEVTSVGALESNAQGDLFLGGSFKGNLAKSGWSISSSQGKSDLFVIKRSQSGTGDWAVSGGTSENDTVSGMGINSLDEVVIAASLSASGTFGSKATILSGGTDAVLAGITSSGTWDWAQRVASTQNDYAFDLAVNMSDEAIMVGGFGGSITQGGNSISPTGAIDAMAFGFDPATLIDTDADGVPDVRDNCPTVSNPGQGNTDFDSEGDACDSDDDNDGLTDSFPDLCPRNSQYNWTSMQDWEDPANSTDWDNDGCRDSLEDDDDDNDGVLDADDACQHTGYSPPRPTWVSNSTNDLDGDGCRDFDEDFDDDGDGFEDGADACPSVAGTSTFGGFTGCPDGDMDGWADVQDDCPELAGNSTANNTNACPDQDGDGWADQQDAFPFEVTQWSDEDGDGYGDNQDGVTPDACPTFAGLSTVDRYGCNDPDADGRSSPDADWTLDDGADAFPTDPAQWSDFDGDGLGDNHNDPNWDDRSPFWPGEYLQIVGDYDRCPAIAGNSTKLGILGCLDNDGDGYDNDNDAFPRDGTQWTDEDGDGYGDNADGFEADACPTVAGNSTLDRFGCEDYDGDGWSDPFDGIGTDAAPEDPTQWSDADGDFWYDNPNGNFADECPNAPVAPGAATRLDGIDRNGCPDTDFDGYSDPDATYNASMGADACPEDGYDPSITSTVDRFGCLDSDGDGYSDPDASWTVDMGADAFPNDPMKWLPEVAEETGGSSGSFGTVAMIGGVVLLIGAIGAVLVLRGRGGSDQEKAWASAPDGLPPLNAMAPAVAVPPGLSMPASNVAVPPGLEMPAAAPVAVPAPAPVVDPAALSYYQGLLAQGYDPASAQMYTQQYYPGFQA